VRLRSADPRAFCIEPDAPLQKKCDDLNWVWIDATPELGPQKAGTLLLLLYTQSLERPSSKVPLVARLAEI
jgi:hypothetical protein